MAEMKLQISIESFSYRNGLPKAKNQHGGGFVFDCRAIKNPGREERYKQLTGRDREVVEYLEADPDVAEFGSSIVRLVDLSVRNYLLKGYTDLQISFGCTGGQHRSVYFAELLARHLRQNPQVSLSLQHTNLGTLGIGAVRK